MASNVNRRTDYGKYDAPENVEIKTANKIETGDIAVSPSGLQSIVIDKKLVYSNVELNERMKTRYQITFASKTQGVITKIYTPSASISVLKRTNQQACFF